MSGAGWIAAVIAVITVGAIVELWRRRNGASVRRSMGVLIVVVVLALAGILGIAGWIRAAFGWSGALAFVVAWVDYLITLAVAPRGERPSASL